MPSKSSSRSVKESSESNQRIEESRKQKNPLFFDIEDDDADRTIKEEGDGEVLSDEDYEPPPRRSKRKGADKGKGRAKETEEPDFEDVLRLMCRQMGKDPKSLELRDHAKISKVIWEEYPHLRE